jgi:biotin carboxyl carrier protein
VQYDIQTAGRVRRVTVTHTGDRFTVEVDGRRRDLDVRRVGPALSLVDDDGRSYDVSVHPVPGSADVIVCVGPHALTVRIQRGRTKAGADAAHSSDIQRIVAPMPGKIVRILVRPGDVVSARQPLMVVEAMKMENEVRAGQTGVVTEILASEGALVESGAVLAVIGPASEPAAG